MSKNNKSQTLESLEKTLNVVELLKSERKLTLSQISSKTGLPKSSVHRYLSTFRSRGYIVFDGSHYQLGSKFLDAGLRYRERTPLFQEAKHKVDELAEKTGEVSGCFIEEQGKLVYLYTKYGENAVKVMEGSELKLGAKKTLHTSASGKAILANLPSTYVDEIIQEHGLPSQTSNTITEKEVLLDELAEIREQGYALSFEEGEMGRNSIGAPILYESNKVAGAVGITGPANRLNRDRLESDFPEILLGLSNEIELNLKYNQL
ncbi:DNA-binding transcriptional regulator, IclR family [Halopenitus malekzadehii]|uniref:DNA-binding transcriptional regulator, IclR family n=1 Tax=Halopenitus malekzadehii TaxID=1267564 RepID=A0A1H6JYD4_9EURY|nr:IclR family transcriptional regulator [Halopenitus malekzadehii]SEH64135.1 DNA-binding transcriptional regulator, IclR family [Halopenitus malekzadehii]